MTATRSTPARPGSEHEAAGHPFPRRRPLSKAAIAGRVLRYAGLIVLAAIYVSPLVFMFLTSFKSGPDATSVPPTWIPDPWTTQAYETVFSATNTPVLRWFLNSMIAATLHAALVVVTAALAAYPLARMNFRGRSLILALVIGTLLVPPVILIVPSFLVVNELGWLNTLVAVIVPTAASAFGVFFLRQFFLSIPIELEEAAELDGANKWTTFTRVVLPLAKPALATLALLAFLTNWNDFLWPVYVLFSPDLQTLPAGLATLQSANAVRYDLLMAGAALASAPVLALFIFLQRYIIEGVARSGVKG
jgi:multiple sugar transport system permease protein